MLDPAPDCGLCPRLADFRAKNAEREPHWFNAPVPTFGGLDAQLLVVGLAPGLKGANRTGRPFTGDYAGDLLYPSLIKFGFAKGAYDQRPDDGLEMVDCRITNAVRCVPPENKPTTPEIKACLPFLADEIAAMPNLKAIMTLGLIAHGAVLTALGLKKSQYKFGHGQRYELDQGRVLFNSYHCSRYNTNTGRLTEAMFWNVIDDVRQFLDG